MTTEKILFKMVDGSALVFWLDFFRQKEKSQEAFKGNRRKTLYRGLFIVIVFLSLLYLGPPEGLKRFGFFVVKKIEQLAGAAVPSSVVYDDALQNGFKIDAYDASATQKMFYNLSSTTTVHSGTYAIETDMQNWGTVAFYQTTQMTINNYNTINFWVYEATPSGLPFTAYLLNKGNNWSVDWQNSVDLIKYLPKGPVDTWTKVSIPIADFSLGYQGGDPFYGFVFRFNNSGNYGHIFFDDISLSLEPDITPPIIASVVNADFNTVNVTFSEKVDQTTATTSSNYSLISKDDPVYDKPVSPAGAKLDATGRTVALSFDTAFTNGKTYTLTVSNVKDLAGNPIAVDSTASFTVNIQSITLTVDASKKVRPFNPMMRGGSLVGWMHAAIRMPYPGDIPGLVELSKNIKPGIVRYAGGLWANNYIWDRTGTIQEWTTVANGRHIYNPAMMDSLAKFKQATGAEVMMQINVCTDKPGVTPAMFADMLHYTNIEHNYGFKYWELGNELNLNPPPCSGIDPTVYAQRFIDYRKALLAVDPTVKVIGPVLADFNPVWFQALVSATNADGKPLDAATYHWYQSGEGYDPNSMVNCQKEYGPSVDVLFNYNTTLTDCTWPYDQIHNAPPPQVIADDHWLITHRRRFGEVTLNTLKGILPAGTQRGITELNTMWGDGKNPFEGNYVAALWFADELGRLAYAGLDFDTMWDLYDDTDYSLIYPDNDVNPTKFWIRPTYYTYLMYAKWFGDEMVQSATSDTGQKVTIWASSDSNDLGKLKLIITNLTGTNINATLNIGGFTPVSGVYYEMNSANPLDTTAASAKGGGWTTINGATVDTSDVANITPSINNIPSRTLASVGTSFAHVFPAYSATSIILSTTGQPISTPTPTSTPVISSPTPSPTPVVTPTPSFAPISTPTVAPSPTPKPGNPSSGGGGGGSSGGGGGGGSKSPPSTKLGDINGDGVVSIRDLSILLSRWGTSDPSADLNHDGIVNIRDLSILLSRWGT